MTETTPPIALPAPDPNALTPQEQRLVDCAARGEWWLPEWIGGEIQLDLDPAYAYGWRDNRTIRANVIRCLAAGEPWPGIEKPWPVHRKGLRVSSARISGALDLEGATLNRALWLNSCGFDEQANLRDAETQTVSFQGSHMPNGLDVVRAVVKGHLHLRNGFSAKGGVDLAGARIERDFDCGKGHFENIAGAALGANGLTVGANVFMLHGFNAKGEVDLIGAKIEGYLICDGSRFENVGGWALNADSIAVGRHAFLRSGFSAKGEVNLYNAVIKGSLHCESASFSNPAGNALNLALAEIGAGLFFRRLKPAEANQQGLTGRLVLEQAKCKTYSDDRRSWPEAGKLVLDGFTYERFHDCETDCKTRRDWLRLQESGHLSDSFRPQPWMQAVKVLHEMGHDDDARDLAVEREMARREGEKNPARKAWLTMLHATVGSGYKPWWALYWSLAFFLVGWLTFYSANELGYMAPRDGSVIAYLAANPGKPVPPRYTEFNSFLYAADAFLPVIELGQDQAWEPATVRDTKARPLPSDLSPHSKDIRGLAQAYAHGAHRVVYWAEEVLGWIFVSLFIAGMSGIMKKE
jgi:hypothetical protein